MHLEKVLNDKNMIFSNKKYRKISSVEINILRDIEDLLSSKSDFFFQKEDEAMAVIFKLIFFDIHQLTLKSFKNGDLLASVIFHDKGIEYFNASNKVNLLYDKKIIEIKKWHCFICFIKEFDKDFIEVTN